MTRLAQRRTHQELSPNTTSKCLRSPVCTRRDLGINRAGLRPGRLQLSAVVRELLIGQTLPPRTAKSQGCPLPISPRLFRAICPNDAEQTHLWTTVLQPNGHAGPLGTLYTVQSRRSGGLPTRKHCPSPCICPQIPQERLGTERAASRQCILKVSRDSRPRF